MSELEKALTTSTGSALIPTQIDKEINDLVVKETPLISVLKEIPWSTLVYRWNERTARASAGAYDESDVVGSSSSTPAQRTITLKMIKSDVLVSNLEIAATQDYINSFQSEIESASVSMAHELERLYIEGNATANAKEFDGLSSLVTLTYDAACAAISLDILDGAINAVQLNGGKPNLIVLANRDLQQLHKVMRVAMVYNWEKLEVAAGVYLTNYRGIPLIGSSFISTALGVSGTESYGFVLDTTQIKIPTLLPITFEDLSAKTTLDAKVGRIKTYRAMAVKGYNTFHCKINAIARP